MLACFIIYKAFYLILERFNIKPTCTHTYTCMCEKKNTCMCITSSVFVNDECLHVCTRINKDPVRLNL